MLTHQAFTHSITVRLRIENKVGMFARILAAIARARGDMGSVDLVSAHGQHKVRDLTINARDEAHVMRIMKKIRKVSGVQVLHVSDRVFLLHIGGKLHIQNKVPITTRDAFSMAYVPGVTRICSAIAQDKEKVKSLTIKQNSVAVVSDGTAILGLGNIGPEGAMPALEGKAMLFKEFADIDAYPIALRTQDTEEIIRTISLISTGFGGINLEGISAPRCFEIEDRLERALEIPVFHDNQHATSIVVLAAILNALKVVGRTLRQSKIVVVGAGVAGVAITKLLLAAGARDILVCDRGGIINKTRMPELSEVKRWLARNTNQSNRFGDLVHAATGADILVCVSSPGTVPPTALRKMARNAVVIALATPDPDVAPDVATRCAKVVATSRSDFPNQISSVLAFPGVFRGALRARSREINEPMKLAAAHAIADCITPAELSAEYIIPSIFNAEVPRRVAQAVEAAAYKSGVAKRQVVAPVGSGSE
ncbi:MAG: NAD-dependent malic enzyme [Verrucomicrobiae bacterium]|nr:NAD-dependent malic enzyme [Verrucomicrobiae bacterium]